MSYGYFDLEERAKTAGLSVRQWCLLARVSYSTAWRWKTGKTMPLLATVKKLEAVIDKQSGEGQ